MALPAGRYGVTKSMLQKIKNLPMDTLKMINDLIHDKTEITVISENVEDGEKASKAYVVGEHFMRNGKFATVTASIASGDTLTENTNYTVGDISSLLTVIMQNATSAGGTVTISNTYEKVYRQGNVVNFNIRFTLSEASTTASTALLNLPWVPIISNPHFAILNRTAPYETVCNSFVSTTGRLSVSGVVLEAGTYEVGGTYICQ